MINLNYIKMKQRISLWEKELGLTRPAKPPITAIRNFHDGELMEVYKLVPGTHSCFEQITMEDLR